MQRTCSINYEHNNYRLLPATREITYLLCETRGREAPEGERGEYVTSRGRRVVTYLLPNKGSLFHSEEIFCCPVPSRVPACDIQGFQYLKSHVKNYSNE